MTEAREPKRCSPHGWTLDALAARADALEKMLDEREARTAERFEAAKESVSSALNSAERAISKSEVAYDKRFDGVNEMRASLNDMVTRLVPRMEYQVQYQTLIDKFDSMLKIINLLEGRISAVEVIARTKKEGLGVVGSIVLACFAGLSALAAAGAFFYTVFHHA